MTTQGAAFTLSLRLGENWRQITDDMRREKITKYETNGMDWSAAKRKAHEETLMKRKMCFHKTLVEFMCQLYHLRNEGTMGRIFNQLDYLVDKGEDMKHAVKKVVNNHKYKCSGNGGGSVAVFHTGGHYCCLLQKKVFLSTHPIRYTRTQSWSWHQIVAVMGFRSQQHVHNS